MFLVPMQRKIRSFIGVLPIVNSLFYFNWETHKLAIPKFLTLWVSATLPIFCLALFSDVPNDEGNIAFKYAETIFNLISSSEIFVYASSFLSPLLFIFYEKYQMAKKSDRFFDNLFSGYGFNSILSLLVLLIAAASYGYVKAPSHSEGTPFFSILLIQSIATIFMDIVFIVGI